MKSKLLLASVSAGAAAGLAFYYFSKKHPEPRATGLEKKNSQPVKSSYSPARLSSGNYSFISGFKDAATVEMTLSYDADAFGFHVSEDEFLVESGDSHVAILSGELFSAQFEYAAYYSGEDYGKLTQELSSKHKDLIPVSYGTLRGLKFRDGDNLALIFPIPDDVYSYLHVTLIKAKDNDDDLEAIADYPDLNYILSSMRFSRS